MSVPGDAVVDHRNAERLKFFTDAVVAIALTLLVLPLLESVPDAAREHRHAADWLAEHGNQMIGLAVSFAVVATFWIQHHRIFEHVARYSLPLVILSFVWMLSVVFLQVPTALVYALPTDRTLIGLYIGTMCVGSAMLLAMTWVVYRSSVLQEPDNPMTIEQPITAMSLFSMYVAALALGLIAPSSVGYFAMFAMAFTAPVRRLVARVARPR